MSNTATTAATAVPNQVRPKVGRDDWMMRAFMGVIALYLLATLAFPLYTMFSKSFENSDGEFIGLGNYIEYVTTPALFHSVYNSLFISILTTLITSASSAQRATMPGRLSNTAL